MADENAGAAYGALITEQLVEERARKTSLEQRGLSVITTSGTLVTLLFAVAGLVTAREGFALPSCSRWFLAGTLLAFVFAAGFGIATNWPVNYGEPSKDDLQKLLAQDEWGKSATTGQLASANVRLKALNRAREQNGRKAEFLRDAMLAQVVAVLLLAIAIGIVLWAT